MKRFQSTLPRRERHSAFAAINPSIVISIHTPTKGATWNNSTHTYTVTAISIHTPTKGATCLNIYKPRKDVNFNPHSHEGSDCRSRTRPTMITVFQSTLPRRERQSIRADENKRKIISIHTPTKGATYKTLGTPKECRISIHTPTKGATEKIRADSKS